MTQIDHGICQKLESEMSWLYPLKPKQQPFKLVFPGEGSLHSQTKRMNVFIKQPFPTSLGFLTIPLVFRDIGGR